MWFFLKKSMLLDFFVLSSSTKKKNNVGNVLNEFVFHANLKYFINEIKQVYITTSYDESCWSFKGN